jgi:N-terminal acetyltransferase B complex non-catalytic subunit
LLQDAIDSGAYKTAIQACNKILKKQPKSLIAKVCGTSYILDSRVLTISQYRQTLKSLALLRSAKVDEAIPLCDEVFEARPTDENVVMALAQVLRQLERHEDIITLYDSAFKANPNGEELGFQAFLAMIRIGNWKSAQQISHRMSRTFKNESRYLCWSVMCAVLQACDPDTEEKTKSVLLNLALHLFRQLPPAASHLSSPDKLHLLLEIYLSHTKPQLEEAYELLSSKAGRDAANSSLAVDEVRHLVWMKHGKFVEERDLSRERLSNG